MCWQRQWKGESLKLSELSSATLEHIKTLRFDQILEKHEGPPKWASELEYGEPEFMSIDGFDVLLPIEKTNHAKITILRCIPSADGNTLTIFLSDKTYFPDPEFEKYAGRLAICEKITGTQFYIASVYHEWFVIDTYVS
jgi:hypothetical protein